MRTPTLIALAFFALKLCAQNCCDLDQKTVICYTPQAYCNTNSCFYTLDGGYMTGLLSKLNNVDNFGPNGTISCEIEFSELVGISNADDIEDLKCEIVFFGNFALDNNAGFGTYLPPTLLTATREWSQRCEKNLAIVFQGESEEWGYGITNSNQNPNLAGDVDDPNVFSGPFGTIQQFDQGGSFQANFSKFPSSGWTILAVDQAQRPTIILDELTNDLVLADVGILCNTAGLVSNGPNVINDNDILACNILALGCQISRSGSSSEEFVFICENEDYTLPDGTVVDQPGEFESNLIDQSGCDSTITTILEFSIPTEQFIVLDACTEDNFSLTIGDDVYGESNPIGTTIVPNQYNCDSIVNVDISFFNPDQISFDTATCFGEPVSIGGLIFTNTIDTTIVLQNQYNCDSLLIINIVQALDNSFSFPATVEVSNQEEFIFNYELPPGFMIEWSPQEGLSCYDCPNPKFEINQSMTYQVLITSPEGCSRSFDLDVLFQCIPYLPNAFTPGSIVGNESFGPKSDCILSDYSLTIFDRWGNEIFISESPEIGWDGRFNNQNAESGVYVYRLEYLEVGKMELYTGHVTLIR